MRSNQRYPRDARQFSNERDNFTSNQYQSSPQRQPLARQSQNQKTRNSYQQNPDLQNQARSFPQTQSFQPQAEKDYPTQKPKKQSQTGRQGPTTNEDITTQKRSNSNQPNIDMKLNKKKPPAKSVYNANPREQYTPDYGNKAQSAMHDVDRESVASYIDGELIIPGNKGSFSDKQTTNYDIQSRKTNRTNKDGTKGKKSARGKNKEPLPKVEEIMKKSGMQPAKLDLKDAGACFDDPEEKENVMKAIQGIFRVNKTAEAEEKLFGITMQQWETSRVNPKVIAKLNQDDSDSSDGDDQKKKKHQQKKDAKVKQDKALKDSNRDNAPWWDAIIIGHRNTVYMIFNIFICFLCIISSYFYLSAAGFRYTYHEKDTERFNITRYVFECIFLFDFILQWFREYKLEGYPPVRDLGKIATHYVFEGTFMIDLVCLIPFGGGTKRNRWLLQFLLKMLRLYKGFSLFDVQVVMNFIKTIQYEKTQNIVDNRPDLAEDTISDHNNVEGLLMTSYTLKILKLFIIIANIAYCVGVGWFVLCEGIRDFMLDVDIGAEDESPWSQKYDYPDGFLVNYGILENTREQNQIIAIYFAFTSLSTVGFGDYAPCGNIERFIGSFILLFGVSIFSYIMGNFIDILSEFQAFHEPLDEGDRLSKFFGTIQEFNGQKPMNSELKKEIEDHFHYRWEKDKLAAFRDDSDVAIFDQLPIDTQIMMYKEFLFKDFLETYKRTFCFRDYECPDQPAFYTWENPQYRNFMFDLLKCLEPRSGARNEVVFNELDEVNEVIFFMSGAVDIGFEINRHINYVLRIDNNILLGAYNVAYNKRSKFNYKLQKSCTGFSIRRIDWKKFMYQPENKTVAGHLRKQIKKDYEIFIMNKVRMEKKRAMLKWDKRADYDAVLRVVDTWKTGMPASKPQDSSSDDLNDGIEHGSTEMVGRLIKKFDHYERETRGILQCYDELEDDYDFLQEKFEQSERENQNLHYQIQRLMAEKASKDYSKVQRVVPTNQATKAGTQSQVVGLNLSPPKIRPRSTSKQLHDEPGIAKMNTVHPNQFNQIVSPEGSTLPIVMNNGQNLPQIPKQRPSANKFSRAPNVDTSPLRAANSPTRLTEVEKMAAMRSQKLGAPPGDIKGQTSVSGDKTGFKNSSVVNNRFNNRN